MYEALKTLLDSGKLSVIERFDVPGKPARYSDIPKFLFDSRIGIHLLEYLNSIGGKKQLWKHQATALEALGKGGNVIVSTGSASGKSLIFMSLAFHRVLLGPNERVLVFYPLKALVADQIRGWQRMTRLLKLDESTVGRIDGSVPVREREDILERSKIVVVTPDVCHAWLMSRLALPVVQQFISSLSVVVMDEAHYLEGVFGSNFAFLIRRLISARSHLLSSDKSKRQLQFVAASATIHNPGDYLKELTGMEFKVVDHNSDGAKRYERIVAHIACPLHEEGKIANEIQKHLLAEGVEGGFITFIDSRRRVESLALESIDSSSEIDSSDLVQSAEVLPYRAGYEETARKFIEKRLKKGNLRGVVSTSALELGIDIPHLRVGLNLGVPDTRKAYLQRLGRVGRSGPGIFLVIAPHSAFRAYGTSFQEYHEMSVEPSYLYLENRFMQFAHGRCLSFELESLEASPKTPVHIDWPDGFKESHSVAKPGGSRPEEFDAIANMGGDQPHYGYPLRNIGEVNYAIKFHKDADSIGEVTQLQALRECYPGATYLHMGNAYKIRTWYTGFNPTIIVERCQPNLTQPRINTWVNASITSSSLQKGHFKKGEKGFLAECQMMVTERVVGYKYRNSGQYNLYTELQKKNSNMSSRSRYFRTTGVLLCLDVEWFKEIRKLFADKLLDVFAREYSVSLKDISSHSTNISVQSADFGGRQQRYVVVYDETYGSLRLTERIFLEFDHILNRIIESLRAEPEDDKQQLREQEVMRIQEEVSRFSESRFVGDESEQIGPAGKVQVYTPGSRVCHMSRGQIGKEVVILKPILVDDILMYQLDHPMKSGDQPTDHLVSAARVQPLAESEHWDLAWWDPLTGQYVDDEPSE